MESLDQANLLITYNPEIASVLNTVTLDQVIDSALQLPQEQCEMLLEILRNRQIDIRRLEIAADARSSIDEFHEGKFKAQSAKAAIAELHETAEDS